MKYIVVICLLVMFAACGTGTGTEETGKDSSVNDSTAGISLSDSGSIAAENDDYNYAEYFVVIADTGRKYIPLFKKMVNISLSCNMTIDTMNRHYDFERDLIALPEDDPDEIYAGEYYPRRDPSTFLSLEYLDYFQEKATEKTIALVAGIYENEVSADSALKVLREKEARSFKVKSRIYIGCMH